MGYPSLKTVLIFVGFLIVFLGVLETARGDEAPAPAPPVPPAPPAAKKQPFNQACSQPQNKTETANTTVSTRKKRDANAAQICDVGLACKYEEKDKDGKCKRMVGGECTTDDDCLANNKCMKNKCFPKKSLASIPIYSPVIFLASIACVKFLGAILDGSLMD